MNPHDSRAPRAIGPDRIGQLVKLAGRRPVPEPEQMLRARTAAHAEWTRVVERRGWRVAFRALGGAAIAAGVLAAVAWSLMRQPSAPAPLAEIAAIQTVTGSIRIISANGTTLPVSKAGEPIRAGDRVETIDGRAAFVLPGHVSVRLNRDTTTVFDSVDRILLERGEMYVDAGPGPGGAALRVETPFGVVRHTGTQFEVRLDQAVLRVRVREGSVAVETPGERLTSRAGEAITLERGRPPRWQPTATSGSDWGWVTELAPPFRLEGAAAPAFLQWASRELGLQWEYADPSLRARVERIVLHGSIEGMTPDEALAAVLPTCGLTFRRDGERLIVGAAR